MKELHPNPRDVFDQASDQGRQLPSQAELEASGMSRRQAGGVINSRMAVHRMEEAGRSEAEKRAARDAERGQEHDQTARDLTRVLKNDGSK